MKLGFAVLCLVASANGQSWFASSSTSDLETKAEGLLAKAKHFAGDNVGEGGIGFAAGTVAGFMAKKVQNIVVGSAVVCGGIVGGACLAGWVNPEDVKEKAEKLAKEAQNIAGEQAEKLTGVLAALDADHDGKGASPYIPSSVLFCLPGLIPAGACAYRTTAVPSTRSHVVDLKDSKMALSKFAKKHTGLTAGLVGGALVGYKFG